MQRSFLFLLCAFSLVLSSRADSVDKLVRSKMKEHPIPALALTIVKNGKPVKTAAYGTANLELKVPATAETVFEIGSLTKQFTAVGIMLLAQEGKLSVDDKICRHLKNTPAAWKDITIRHLLTHTSGIKSYTFVSAGFELSNRLTQEQFIERIGAFPLDSQPGEKFSYCNTGFSLLGYIIENVSGQGYWTFMQERIFGPLAMSHTRNRDPWSLLPNRASGYETNKAGQYVNRDYNLTDVFSAGAIASTVGDLAKWNAALDSEKLLTQSSKEQMWTSGKLNNGNAHHYGFGFFVSSLAGHKNIHHSGSTSGFSADIQRFPDDGLTIIVLTNSDENGVATTVAQAIAELYLKIKAQ